MSPQVTDEVETELIIVYLAISEQRNIYSDTANDDNAVFAIEKI